MAEHVIAKASVLLPRSANADTFFVPIRKAEDTLWIAVHDLDQIGQRALNLSGMQRKVGRSTCEFANALYHAFTVRRDFGSKCTQAIGKRLACGGDDLRAAKQSDLNGSESCHGST